MTAKTIKESALVVCQQMTQADANLVGSVHGGTIMKLIDNTAGIVAYRHSQGLVVTASIDRLDFYNQVFVGDLVRVKASVNLVGTSSMEIGVRVESENVITGKVKHTATAYLIFVALNDKMKPRKVPELILETDDDKRRNDHAKIRKESRAQYLHKMKFTQNGKDGKKKSSC
jgi:acyl-CoA hydrolase